jgi:hypothetical protein
MSSNTDENILNQNIAFDTTASIFSDTNQSNEPTNSPEETEVALGPVAIGLVIAVASLAISVAALAYSVWYNQGRDTSIYRDLAANDREGIKNYENIAKSSFENLQKLGNQMNVATTQSAKFEIAKNIITQANGLAGIYDALAKRIDSSIFTVAPGSDTINQLQERVKFYREQSNKMKQVVDQVKHQLGNRASLNLTLEENATLTAQNQPTIQNKNTSSQQSNNIDPGGTFIQAYNSAPDTTMRGSIEYARNVTLNQHPNIDPKNLDLMEQTILSLDAQARQQNVQATQQNDSQLVA